MATIKDVAKLAGVSPSTVSRTLTNRIFVEEETRQKVLKAVAELNYQPSSLARGLREGKTQMLAFLVPDINSLFYPMMMKSIERYATEKGYSLILCNNDEKIENEKKNIGMMGARGIDGLLCMSVEDDVRHLEEFQRERGIPVILVNRMVSEQLTSVSFDDEYGGYLMTKYLLDHGHTKIAAMFGGFGRQRFRERWMGCKRAMEEYGITDYDHYFIYDVNSIEEAFQRTKEILEGEDRPTAFFATMDILAIGIYSGISFCGCRIPDDISLVGFDNIFMAQYMVPPLTTYAPPIDDVARESMECLLAQLNDPTLIRNISLKGELIERQSVRHL
ncbi:MAG: LacI family transcriptional regulator [Clostridiales bacterium]|nr:LacI family transcriptional regulator [Clostridiales bacterium]MCD8369068.1 LacI family transcriptional regulator [Clostridiales bacterium]